jgi:hypothetical protein
MIIGGKTKCVLCDAVLLATDDIVATTHFITDASDPLWRYSDAAMHRACFVAWKHRDAFRAKYNETVGRVVWGNGTRHHFDADGNIRSIPAPEE